MKGSTYIFPEAGRVFRHELNRAAAALFQKYSFGTTSRSGRGL